MYTRVFADITNADASIAGGKGASLGEMTNAHIPVPPGFVLLTEAFERFLDATDLRHALVSAIDSVDTEAMRTIENASQLINEHIMRAKMPDDIRVELLKGFTTLDTAFVAVRSSATAEDGLDHAWAGQLESYLNVTEEHLIESVQRCWASLFTPRAIAYRFEKGLTESHISVAVVIQKMVQSELSGIAFSVHPVTEDHNQLIIEAGVGLGEAIVSGQVTPDAYVVEKDSDEIIDINVNEQTKALYRDEAGGNRWRTLGTAGAKQVLTSAHILELASLIKKIESHYGVPQDIEWAYEDGQFYITQSRPITTLQPDSTLRESRPTPHYLWHQRDYTVLITSVALTALASEEATSYYNFKRSDPYIVVEDGILHHIHTEDDDLHCAQEWIKQYNSHEILLEHKAKLDAIIARLDDILQTDSYNDPIATIKDIHECFREMMPLYFVPFIVPEYITDLDPELLSTFLIMRTEYEAAPRLSIDLHRSLLNRIEAQEDITKHTLGYLLEEEFATFLETKELPKHLSKRNEFVLVHHRDAGPDIFYDPDEIERRGLRSTQSHVTDHCIVGISAERGVVEGTVRIVKNTEETHTINQGDILVTPMTDPGYLPAMKKAGAIVTDEGGVMCHAAIIARELKKPCIIGTKIATQVLKDGDTVEVDADNGVVRILHNT